MSELKNQVEFLKDNYDIRVRLSEIIKDEYVLTFSTNQGGLIVSFVIDEVTTNEADTGTYCTVTLYNKSKLCGTMMLNIVK